DPVACCARYRIEARSRKMRARLPRLTRPKMAPGRSRAGQLAQPGPNGPPRGEESLADGVRYRSGDLGELLGRDFDAAGQRRKGLVGELEERLGVLRAGRHERVEVATRDLALELEQLGRALHAGKLLHVGGRGLVSRLGFLDVGLAERLRAGREDLRDFDAGFEVDLG